MQDRLHGFDIIDGQLRENKQVIHPFADPLKMIF